MRFLLIILACLGTTAMAGQKIATINIKTAIYCDHCMKCESCGQRLEKAVYTEKGIKRVDIDDKNQTVTVVYNAEKTSPEKLRQAIAKAGFDADDIKGNAAVYATWDDCCKK